MTTFYLVLGLVALVTGVVAIAQGTDHGEPATIVAGVASMLSAYALLAGAVAV